MTMESDQEVEKSIDWQGLLNPSPKKYEYHVGIFTNPPGQGHTPAPQKLMNLLFLLMLTISLFPKSSHAADMTDLSRLRADLLNGYDRNARPIQNHQNATVVRFNLFLTGFEFDEMRSVFTIHAWTSLSWKDAHMKWDPKAYGNATRIHFAAHELWTPDLSVFNNLDKSEIDHFGNTRILAYSNSIVSWVPPTKFQVGCTSDLRNWPVDSQYCTVIVGSWAHDGSMLNVKLPTNKTTMDMISGMQQNREWTMTDNSFQKRVHYYDCCPDVPFPDIFMVFRLQRKGYTHKAAVVVPGLAIAIGVLIAFWIQPGATERLLLILMTVLINTMYLNYIYRILPNNGDSIPLVLLFYRDSLVMAAAALSWTICLRYLAATKRTSPVPLPGFIQVFLASVPAKILCLDPRPTTVSSSQPNNTGGENPSEGDGTIESGKLVTSGNPYQQDWAWLAHLLDRVAFVIYLIIYLCFYVALL